MKIPKIILFILLTLGLAWAPALAADPTPQTVCPVLGGNVDKQVYTDYQGQRIYFCCQGCDAEFRKDPEKYLKKMQEQGVTPEKAPAPAGKK